MKQRQVYVDDGQHYGGDQSRLLNDWERDALQREKINQLVRKITQQELSSAAIKDYLTKLARQGCGYVAATNLLFQKYAGREKEFEKHFDLAYYSETGQLNFAELLLTFYQAEKHRRLIPGLNYQIWLPYPGVRARDLKGNLEFFTKKTGAPLLGKKLPHRQHTLKDIADSLARGQQIIVTSYFWPLCLVAPVKAPYTTQKIRMHSVVITAVDQVAEQFIISSWGRKYYLRDIPKGSTIYTY